MFRGDVFHADLGPSIGSEANKRRPCLIVSNDANNRVASTVTILPLTSNVEHVLPFEVFLERELDRPCKVQASQIRTISKERLIGVAVATLTDEKMALVDEAVRLHLNL